jgi:hypothetical protein
MTNLSAVTRHKVTRRAAPGWHRRVAGLCVAGAGAALIGLLATPLAHADADDSSLLLAAASTDLPDGAAATAYHYVSNIYEAATSFENSVVSSSATATAYDDALFFSDLTSVGNILSATGLDLGDPFPSGATASDDVSAIVGEDTTLTDQLTDLEQEVDSLEDGNTILALTANQEAGVVLSTLAFQEQINYDIDTLPTITAQDETNPALISDLSALYSNEVNLDGYLVNLGNFNLEDGSVAGITSDNAAILSEALGIANDAQSSAETLTILADLSSIGL